MVLRNLIFQTEVVEQRFRTGMVPHHDEQASENGNPERHVQLPCNMLPPYLCLLIAVTFSTPTGDFTQNRIVSVMAMLRQRPKEAPLRSPTRLLQACMPGRSLWE